MKKKDRLDLRTINRRNPVTSVIIPKPLPGTQTRPVLLKHGKGNLNLRGRDRLLKRPGQYATLRYARRFLCFGRKQWRLVEMGERAE